MTDRPTAAIPDAPSSGATLEDVADGAREAFARFPTGVAVVTASADDGSPQGLTVASVVSHSMDPPTVSFNVGTTSWTGRVVRAADHLAVHLLAVGQEPLGRRFAARVSDRFAGLDWKPGDHDVPVLAGAQAVLTCRRAAVFEHGDHAIVLGTVIDIQVDDRAPLVYHDRRYRGLGDTP